MSKIAVIGDKQSVLAFKATGMDIFTPDDKNEARKIIQRLANGDYGIIFVTEKIAVQIHETIKRFDRELTPVLIPIPSNRGTLHLGMDRINENLEKAVGRSLFREEG